MDRFARFRSDKIVKDECIPNWTIINSQWRHVWNEIIPFIKVARKMYMQLWSGIINSRWQGRRLHVRYSRICFGLLQTSTSSVQNHQSFNGHFKPHQRKSGYIVGNKQLFIENIYIEIIIYLIYPGALIKVCWILLLWRIEQYFDVLMLFLMVNSLHLE